MDRQIESPANDERCRKRPYRSGHLMCRTPLWGIAGFVACAYFTWVSFSRVLRNEFNWPHDGWTAATYLVWVILLAAFAVDTRCLREQLFFSVLVINFLVGFGFTSGEPYRCGCTDGADCHRNALGAGRSLKLDDPWKSETGGWQRTLLAFAAVVSVWPR